MQDETTNNLEWYRQFWPWFLIALPATAVVASFATLYIAAQNPPDLVVEDYERIAEITAEKLARDNRAAELDLHAELVFSPSADEGKRIVTVSLTGNSELPETLILRTTHSTLARLDAEALLTGAAGYYTGQLPLMRGAYDIHLEAPDLSWKLSARTSGQPDRLELINVGDGG